MAIGNVNTGSKIMDRMRSEGFSQNQIDLGYKAYMSGGNQGFKTFYQGMPKPKPVTPPANGGAIPNKKNVSSYKKVGSGNLGGFGNAGNSGIELKNPTIATTQADTVNGLVPSEQYVGTLGSTAGTNPNTQKVLDTTEAMRKTAQETADANAAIQRQAGQEASDVVAQSNQASRDQFGRQSAELDKINADYAKAQGAESAREDELLRMQHDIARRQANASAARAGQSGLTMSDSTIQGIQDDAISKFGSNIEDAMKFRTETGMKIAEAVANMAKDINVKKGDITKALQALTDKEKAPVLTAIAEAAKGNVDAQSAVRDFIMEMQGKKATEEYNRMSRRQRIEDTNDEYQKAGLATKVTLVTEALMDKEEDGGMGPAGGLVTSKMINDIIAKYPAGTPMAQIIADAKGEAYRQQTYLSTLAAKMQQGQALTPKEKAFWDKFGNLAAMAQTNSLPADYGSKIKTAEGTIQSQGPSADTGMNRPTNQANAPVEQNRAATGGGKAIPTTATIQLNNIPAFVQKAGGREQALQKLQKALNRGLITIDQYNQAVRGIG